MPRPENQLKLGVSGITNGLRLKHDLSGCLSAEVFPKSTRLTTRSSNCWRLVLLPEHQLNIRTSAITTGLRVDLHGARALVRSGLSKPNVLMPLPEDQLNFRTSAITIGPPVDLDGAWTHVHVIREQRAEAPQSLYDSTLDLVETYATP